MKQNQKRTVYLLLTVILIAAEVLIALFVHDDFVRPYVGDMLVVIVLYTLIRTVIPEKCRLLPLFIFLFAVGVEWLQYLHLIERLGLADNAFLRILIGSTFDLKDIACYAVGCGILGLFELLRFRSEKRKTL